jgi:hypothetical protein
LTAAKGKLQAGTGERKHIDTEEVNKDEETYTKNIITSTYII